MCNRISDSALAAKRHSVLTPDSGASKVGRVTRGTQPGESSRVGSREAHVEPPPCRPPRSLWSRLVCGFRLAFQARLPKVVAPRPQAGQKMMHMAADRNGTARPASADPFLAPTPVPVQAADSDASVRFSPEAQSSSRPVKTSEPAKQIPAGDPARLLREGLLLKKDADYFIASDPAKAMLGFLNTINETSARGSDPNTSRDIQSGWKEIRRMAADAVVKVASLAIASAIDRFDKSTGRGTQADQAERELNADMNNLLNKFDENQVALLVNLTNRYYADAEKKEPSAPGNLPAGTRILETLKQYKADKWKRAAS
jgi:hypothetical protein